MLLFLNDHVLKGAHLLPAWLTGKLSDAAGLFLFPIVAFVLLQPLVRRARRPVADRVLAAAAAGITALVFALAKVVPAVNQVMARAWGPMVPDATDLLMLPFAALSAWALLARPASRPHPRAVRLGALAATLLVCAATQPPPPRCYPVWNIPEPASAKLGCAWVESWVSKSGKEGLGVTLSFHPVDRDESCLAEIRGAVFDTTGLRIAATRLPAGVELKGAASREVYVPFAFDNQSLWNRSLSQPELRRGLLSLQISVGGASAERLEIPLAHEWQTPEPRSCGPPRPPSDLEASGKAKGSP